MPLWLPGPVVLQRLLQAVLRRPAATGLLQGSAATLKFEGFQTHCGEGDMRFQGRFSFLIYNKDTPATENWAGPWRKISEATNAKTTPKSGHHRILAYKNVLNMHVEAVDAVLVRI
jgi:hypothetical protein